MKEKDKIFFFISAFYVPGVGRGGVAEAVSQLESCLKLKYEVTKIALFGIAPPNGDDSAIVLQNLFSHSPESNIILRALFWICASLSVLAYIVRYYFVLKRSIIVSCSPGSSHILPFFFHNVIVWENVAFFSKRIHLDYLRLLHLTLAKCTLVVPTFTEYKVLSSKFPLLKVVHCHDWFSPGQKVLKSRCPDGLFRMVAAGALEHRKGFDLLISAIAHIKESQRQKIRLDIFGAGPLRSNLENLIIQSGLSSTITLKGFDENLYQKFQYYDIFILSSRYEGFPLVLINALANGLPALAFDCPTGPAEVIIDGLNGKLVEANNVKSMANYITDYADNPEKLYNPNVCSQSVKKYSLEDAAMIWFNSILHK